MNVMSGAAYALRPERPLRILVLDPDAVLLRGLGATLAGDPQFIVAGTSESIEQGAEMAGSLDADVIITEARIGASSMLELVERLRGAAADVRLVVLTQHVDETEVRAAMSAGVCAYLCKDDPYSELADALRAVAAGHRYLSATVESQVLANYAHRLSARHGATTAPITAREREVLARIGQGQTNKHIAKALRLSVKTVEKHRSNLMRKLGLHNTAAVTVYAMRQGLVSQ